MLTVGGWREKHRKGEVRWRERRKNLRLEAKFTQI